MMKRAILAAVFLFIPALAFAQLDAVSIAPGFTTQAGRCNTGADQITPTVPFLVPQFCVVTIPQSMSPYHVIDADHARMVISAGSNTFILPNPDPTTQGTTWQFGSDGRYGFTLRTVGGVAKFYGCAAVGSGNIKLSVLKNVSVFLEDDGVGYHCTQAQ